MRFLAALAVLATLLSAAPGDTQGRGGGHHGRDQDAAYRAMQQGDILPLNVILSRVRLRNARFIGADLDSAGAVYRLTFMGEGGNVVRLHVDARTGRALGFSR
ncbi:MAG TPA: hypothetical protein VEW25_12365 [Allosphingosinicella sp.]|nr:hypothetical protein [Allosphingosinicella sp.]